MEENINAHTAYSACSHLERQQQDTGVDEAIINAISKDYRVLPLYEKKIFDLTRIKHSSLRRNQHLARRWSLHVDSISGRVRHFFQFPCVDDFHYHNYHNRYAPSQSITHRGNYHLKLAPGPGVDGFGQMPIPSDMHLRKSANTARAAILKKKPANLKKRKRF